MKTLLLFLGCFLIVGLAACGTAGGPRLPNEAAQEKHMETINQDQAIFVVGVELRTTNDKAFTDIPLHWQKFYQNAVLEKIPNKVSRDVYAVYTNFENPGKNNLGVYSLIIGAQVRDLGHVSPPFASATIQKSNRRVFPVTAGHPEKVGEKWQEIWALADLKKTYVTDYERYTESGQIDIFVGVK